MWLSEIMLQQTQVATVIPYYQRFVASFPSIVALAAAPEDEVLAHWSGLGYYARGRNLHKAARIVVEKYQAEFPRRFEDIAGLPGIGRSTAAAICALAYREHRAILDGNVKRVLARYCGIDGWAGEKKVEEQLWVQAENLLPSPAGEGRAEGARVEGNSGIATYTQALMDMGATVCTRTRPKCAVCPVQEDCVALATDRVDEIPAPRPKKVVPERRATMLVLVHGNEVLLEKRAASGIWGGLWSLPQFDDEDQARHWFTLNGMQASAGVKLESFTHTFTHFKLHIIPLQICVVAKPQRMEQPGRMWVDIKEAMRAAIPTPVRKVLGLLQSDAQHRNGARVE